MAEQGRGKKLPPLDREMKRSGSVGPVVYLFAALLLAALAFAWMSATSQSLPIFG